ncbi:MAG: sulfatase-like hydrolase/transferase [Planctomycetia bacterium]|nr:sulfatase-like hydrolase/transferase [Planctomycetia bacterium]
MVRRFLALLGFLLLVTPASAAPPNIVLLFADDLGYADLGCFGATKWKTPNLDRIAKDGIRFTDFHSSQPVCSASRCSLLTGCYANRLGIHGALGPQARHGIHDDETTIAELLKAKGYATGMVGKWHLGHHKQFLPTRHGFDSYLGLPYSNDMWPHHPEAKKGSYPNLPLIDGETIVDADVTAEDQAKLTELYRDQAVKFIGENKSKPFFLYFAHTFPHVPLFVGEKFRGSSGDGGIYGDVIQEFDAAVGDILAALKDAGIEDNTLVIFTSDNGPWLSYGNHGGTKGPLREGKGSVWEGGTRVPFVAKWPGKIPAGTVQAESAMTIDLLPTIAKFVGADLPKRPIDGKDIGDLLAAKPGAQCPHEAFFLYYGQNELQAVRSGKWKLILPHNCRMIEDRPPGKDGKPAGYRQVKLDTMLFDLETDVGEQMNVADQYPEVVKRLQALAEKARADMGDSLTKRVGTNVREPGRLPDPKAKPQYSAELVFPFDAKHNHAPGIVECPNGDLLISWYRGSGERSADDVAVLGARRKKGDANWSTQFVLADTPGFPDCNTTLFVDAKDRLWLFWPVILANSWESCITQYRVASKFDGPGAPKWDWQANILLKPVDFETVMLHEFGIWKKSLGQPLPEKLGDEYVKKKVGDKLLSRLGWQPRCKPTVLKSGRILLPLYSDTYSAGLMAISDDDGNNWTASKPLAGFGSIQPAVVEKADGTLVAYMRENGVFKKIRVSESKDGGVTWGTVYSHELPNPGSGLDALRLTNGHFALIYNDTVRGRHSLAVSISDDEGKSWKWTRHLEKQDAGSYHYPAIIQSRDGMLHAVYSYFVKDGKSMKHATFNEEWVQTGDRS